MFLALAGLVVLAFWDVFVQGRVFFFRDFGFYFYPKRAIVTEAVRHLRIPFWNSLSGCGEPLLGTYQVAVFYPLALIYYILPMPQSFMWFVVGHFFISGAGMYCLTRLFGARRIAAGVAAIAWAFSPAFVSTVDNVSFLTSLAWLPWCLMFARRLALGGGFRAFAFLVIAFAMGVLAGGPEPVVFTAFIVMALVLFHAVTSARRTGWRGAWRVPTATAGALFLAVVLSGVELVPFVNALSQSARPQLDINAAQAWSAKPSDALLWFLPRFYLHEDRGGIYWRSQHWLKTVYMGVTIPLLATWTVLVMRRKRKMLLKGISVAAGALLGGLLVLSSKSPVVWCAGGCLGALTGYVLASTRKRNIFFALVALFSLLLATGPAFGLWKFFFRYVPGFSLIRYPVKFFLPAAFAMAALAGFGVDDAIVCARGRRNRRLILLFAAIAVTAVVFGFGWWAMRHWRNAIFANITPRQVLEMGEDGVEQAWDRFFSAQWSLGRSAAYLAAGAAALAVGVLFARARIARPYGGIALGLALFADIAIFGAHLNPLAGPEIYTENPSRTMIVPHRPTAGRLYMTPELKKHLRRFRLTRIQDLIGLNNYLSLVKGVHFTKPEDLFRWLSRTSAPPFESLQDVDNWLKEFNSPEFLADVQFEVARETFYPNLNILYGVSTVDSFEPLMPKWHRNLMAAMRSERVLEERAAYLPKLWGVAMVVDRLNRPPDFFYAAMRQPGRRALLADHFLAADSDEEAKDILLDTDIDVTRRVVLMPGDAGIAKKFLGEAALSPPPDNEECPGTARVVSDNGNRMKVEVKADRRALVFVADNYYSAFRATVDGEPAPIFRANLSYRAVPIEPGTHKVEFIYRPTGFYIGLALTAAAALALVVTGRLWPKSAGKTAGCTSGPRKAD